MLTKSQKTHRLFLALNLISFTCVTGDLLNLYLLQLNASPKTMGIISAFWEASFIFSIFGRYLVPILGLVKNRSTMWFLRYLFISPILLPIIPTIRDSPYLFQILGISILAFNIAKGMGIVGDKVVLASITNRQNRTKYIAGCQTQNSVLGILSKLALTLIFATNVPLLTYTLVMLSGIIVGLAASVIFSYIPEPSKQSNKVKPLWQSIKGYWQHKPFLLLIFIVFLLNLALPAISIFIIVYLKKVYFFSDSLVLAFSLLGALGLIVFFVNSEKLLRLLNLRMLYILVVGTVILVLAIILLAAISPGQFYLIFIGILASLLALCRQAFLFLNDLTFYVSSPENDRVNGGITINLARSIAGVSGTIGSGMLINMLSRSGLSIANSLHIFFAICLVIMLLCSFLVTKLSKIV